MPEPFPLRACPKDKPHLMTKQERAREKASALKAMQAACKARANGRCEICHGLGSETHHLLARSQGGKHTVENGAYLCGGPKGCHALVTGHVIKIYGRKKSGRLDWERVG